MKQCVITGASGLIGSHLIPLLDRDWRIFCINRIKTGDKGPTQNTRWLQLDLAQAWDPSALPTKIDAVIHLAQSEHFREFPEKAEQIFNVNTMSTLRLLDYARKAGARTFILASSGGIYGHGEQEFSEEVEIASRGDLGFYLGTKLCSEILAENYTGYMNIIVLRFFFVYGVGQRRTMLIPRLVHSVNEGLPIILQGQDGIRINPIYASDAVAALYRALTLDSSQKINIGGPEVLSLRQIGETIGRVLGKEPKFEVQLTAQPRHLVGDTGKMAHLLVAPQVFFADGIRLFLKA